MVSASTTATLADIGIETIQLLNKVKTTDPPIKNTHQEWPKALFAAEADRFELWTVNLGVFVSGHGSLDYRVRETENFERTLRKFMTDLVGALKEVLEYCSGDIQEEDQDEYDNDESPSDEFQKSLDDGYGDNTTQDIDSDIDLLLDSVRDPIDRLYKLSTRIRNPSSRLGSTKAQRHHQIDEDSGIDLFNVFESFDYDYASSLFLQYRKSKALGENVPDIAIELLAAEESTDLADHVWEPIQTVLSQYQTDVLNSTDCFLIRRIARANVLRRQQFAYWKKHRNKLSQHSLKFTAPFNVPKDITPGPSYTAQQTAQVSDPKKLPTQSVTTASRLNIPQLNPLDNQSTASVSEYAPSAWEPSKEVLGFPDPPLRRSGQKFFECPFCFTLCSTNILAPRAWRAHLIHDLRPYICTYKDCKIPEQQYDTRQDWVSHENSFHRRVWRCPEHPTQTFPQLEGYREHLQREHSNHDIGISGNSITNAGESTLTSPDRCCPICLLNIETLRALQSHIALHLERFSIFSLPRSLDADGDANENDSNKVNLADEGSRDDDFMDSSFDGEGDEVTPANSIARQRWTKLLTEIRLGLKSNRSTTTNPASTQSALMKWIGDRYRENQHDQEEMYDQALAHMDRGELREAENMFQQLREARTPVLGEEHPLILLIVANLALTYQKQGRWKDAEKLGVELMKTDLRILGQDHPNTLTSMANVALIYQNQGRWKEAEELDIQVIERRKKVLGQEHPATLTNIDNLASLFWDQRRWEEAEKLDAEVMEIRKRVFGQEHPETLKSMSHLAFTYKNQGRLDDAEKLAMEAMETSVRSLGPEHPDTLTRMVNLALIYEHQRRLDEAEVLEVQVMELRKRVLGLAHRDTLFTMNDVAVLLYKQGKYEDSEDLHRQTLVLREKVLGPRHPDTLVSMNNFTRALKIQGKSDKTESLDQETKQRDEETSRSHSQSVNEMSDESTDLRSAHFKRHGLKDMAFKRQCERPP